ncbi:MAG TPA: S26 family signal peptidase [Mycobacteriales bacterium]|nr:S26 family signal peptidase [Mycobacteriales bacterium]
MGWRVATVSGASMVPTLADGERLLVRIGAKPRVGRLVLARFPHRPDVVVVKRAVRATPDGWLVLGDNADASEDSRAHGPAEVIGRAWRYPRARRLA